VSLACPLVSKKEPYLKYRLILPAMLVMLSVTSNLAAQSTITFQQALELAIGQNPTVGRSRSEIAEAEAQSRMLRSYLFPRVALTGSAIRNAEEVAFDFGETRVAVLPHNDWNYRLALQQPIYAGGRSERTYRQALLAVDGAREGTRATEDAILLRTASNYLGVIVADALIDVEERNLSLTERRRRQAVDFFEAGEVTRVDVLRADTALKAAQRRLAAAVQMRENAASRLRVDVALDDAVAVAPARIELPPLPPAAELIARAEAARPEIRRADIGVRSAGLEIQKQRGKYLPVITAEASMSQQRVAFPYDQNAAVALHVSIPIWQSGEVGAAVAVAREDERQAVLMRDEWRREVREQVQLALIDLRSAGTQLALAREQLTAATAEYEQTFELYQVQEATSLDVDAAESALAEARRAVAESEVERQLAELRVWYSAGSLKNVLLPQEDH
jgi:outer membrane protein TolC